MYMIAESNKSKGVNCNQFYAEQNQYPYLVIGITRKTNAVISNGLGSFAPYLTVRNTLREIEPQNDYCNGCGLTDHGCGMTLLWFFTSSSLCDTEKVSFFR